MYWEKNEDLSILKIIGGDLKVNINVFLATKQFYCSTDVCLNSCYFYIILHFSITFYFFIFLLKALALAL